MTMRNPNASPSLPITAHRFVSPESTTETIARYTAMKTSSITVTPRIIGVSSLARRRAR